MKIRSLFCFAALLLLYSISDQALAASAPPQRVVITPASFSDREGMLVVAHHQGFFRKYNLDAQLVLMPNAPLALSALTAGESQFYYGTTSGASLGAVLNGLDGVFVAGFVNRLVGAFAVGRDIKTPADLKGKKIGVASLGGGNWMFTMLAFEHWGIDPKRDNITIPFQDSGLFTRKSFLAQRSETVESVLRALVDAIAFIQQPDNKTSVLKSLAQWLRLPKPDDALEGYDFMRKMYARRIYPNVEGIRNSLRVLTLTNEKFGRLKAEDLVDDHIVRKLEKEGLF